MTQRISQFLKRFRAEEDANPTVEFAIVLPAFLIILISGMELGIVNVRHTMLEKGLEVAMRDVRLGTGMAPQHDAIKKKICHEAPMVPNCESNLRLEMDVVSMRNWNGFSTTANCTDQSVEVNPLRVFRAGRDNELVVVRACAKFDPFFPTAGLGRAMAKDGDGKVAIIAQSAFVQEPR